MPGFGVVVAFIDDGELVLVKLDVTASKVPSPIVLARARVAREGLTASRPEIVRGPVIEGVPTVGVLLTLGTCALGEPALVRFALGGAEDDEAPTRALEPRVILLGAGDDGPHDRGHALVYADAPLGYWATWVDGNAIRVRHVQPSGAVLGDAPRAFTAPRVARFDSIGLLGPKPAAEPSLTLSGIATLPSGASVVWNRVFAFP